MKKTVIGILAHVDSGKTTLSESLLYHAGVIRKLGRVDHGDSTLDNEKTERKRGITVFSKQASLKRNDTFITLIDTPGHSDFGAEAERSLEILDAAILVINGSEGVQSHTFTLWDLLKRHDLPVFVFINKMDISASDHSELISDLIDSFGEGFVNFTNKDLESIALCDEEMLESYLTSGDLDPSLIIKAISNRNLYPCFFGSALKLEGTYDFLSELAKYPITTAPKKDFGAKVYRISSDPDGKRLSHLRITGGELSVRDSIGDDKINEIRIYTGAKFSTVKKADAGTICVVSGLNSTLPGTGLGIEKNSYDRILNPAMTYKVIHSEKDPYIIFDKMKILGYESPELGITWNEEMQEIYLNIMGNIQLEIIRSLMHERFNIDVDFDEGSILYKEKISSKAEGIGHFEPIGHYSEVHLIMEPAPSGSGIIIDSKCSTDILDAGRQRVILDHLKEKQLSGTLTGNPLTDTHITLISGKTNDLHTEGGDFIQAAFRAVRQGLMEAGCTLLEPWCKFSIELPSENLGRALNDIQRMGGTFFPPTIENDISKLMGRAPVGEIQNYSADIASFSKGSGRISMIPDGYDLCHDPEKIISEFNYDPAKDSANPSSSIFCKNGKSIIVSWNNVKKYMNFESILDSHEKDQEPPFPQKSYKTGNIKQHISEKEERYLESIFEKTFGPVKERRYRGKKYLMGNDADKNTSKPYKGREKPGLETYVIIDGYNLIFAWKELKELSEINFGASREKLIDILANYKAYTNCNMLVVFDAYKVKGGWGSVENIHGIDVVYTEEAQTADSYIEKVTYEISDDYHVRVVTSDRMEQLIILGNGAFRVSSTAFIKEIHSIEEEIRSYMYDID